MSVWEVDIEIHKQKCVSYAKHIINNNDNLKFIIHTREFKELIQFCGCWLKD